MKTMTDEEYVSKYVHTRRGGGDIGLALTWKEKTEPLRDMWDVQYVYTIHSNSPDKINKILLEVNGINVEL